MARIALSTPLTPVLPAQGNDCDTMADDVERFMCSRQERKTVQRRVARLFYFLGHSTLAEAFLEMQVETALPKPSFP